MKLPRGIHFLIPLSIPWIPNKTHPKEKQYQDNMHVIPTNLITKCCYVKKKHNEPFERQSLKSTNNLYANFTSRSCFPIKNHNHLRSKVLLKHFINTMQFMLKILVIVYLKISTQQPEHLVLKFVYRMLQCFLEFASQMVHYAFL